MVHIVYGPLVSSSLMHFVHIYLMDFVHVYLLNFVMSLLNLRLNLDTRLLTLLYFFCSMFFLFFVLMCNFFNLYWLFRFLRREFFRVYGLSGPYFVKQTSDHFFLFGSLRYVLLLTSNKRIIVIFYCMLCSSQKSCVF